MTYREEFPTFDPASMPAIPSGFIDESWRNDAMPAFRHPAKDLSVFIDYVNPDDRENGWDERYHVAVTSDEGDTETVLSTNDWSEVEALVASTPVRKGYGS